MFTNAPVSAAASVFKDDNTAEKHSVPSAVATDSGIDDPSSYMEPTGIRLGESEFQDVAHDTSLMEGSVADTDYVLSITRPGSQRPKPAALVGAKSDRPEPIGTSSADGKPDAAAAAEVATTTQPKSRRSRSEFERPESRRPHSRSRRTATGDQRAPVGDRSTEAAPLDDSAADSGVRDLSSRSAIQSSFDETRQSLFSGKVTSC